MPDLMNPDDLFEFYKPIVEAFEPELDQAPLNGPPAMIGIVSTQSMIIGPVFGPFSDPTEAISEIHPAMLPGKPTLLQALYASEALGDYQQAREGGEAVEKHDLILLWASTATTSWMGIVPMERTFSVDDEGHSIAAVKYATITDPKPPVWKEYAEGEDISHDPVLMSLRSLVLKDPNAAPPQSKFHTHMLYDSNQEEAE